MTEIMLTALLIQTTLVGINTLVLMLIGLKVVRENAERRQR